MNISKTSKCVYTHTHIVFPKVAERWPCWSLFTSGKPTKMTARCGSPSLIWCLHAQRTQASEINGEFVYVHGESVMPEKQVTFWCNELLTEGVVLLQFSRWQLSEHPSCIPDLVPSVSHLFGPVNRHPAGKRFDADGNFNAKCVAAYRTCAQTFTTRGWIISSHSGINSVIHNAIMLKNIMYPDRYVW
jgi:hypothetical protein